ncbi:TraR/DksA C4-type zinc finger protein [Salmonella enterica]|nr:hypothetical protein [Salmonella enterica]EIA4659288.1 TraR/DksA C4-type zinc finger protein [Salmonella enterica]EJI5637453.1 TraR/DksA C4-type zinc finger protein [Salmonella enterica]EJP9625607.1 TraR/DksA C4-type zinc finger protein [Salmonella enterica]
MDIVDLANEALYQEVKYSSTEMIEGNGVCVDCNCAIPELRLIAMPNALRCLECQEEYEHQQRVVYRSVRDFDLIL